MILEVLILLLSPFHFLENQHCEIADGQNHLALLNYSFNWLNLIHIKNDLTPGRIDFLIKKKESETL